MQNTLEIDSSDVNTALLSFCIETHRVFCGPYLRSALGSCCESDR